MDVQRGHCWRCEKVLPQQILACHRCNMAVYCSKACRRRDEARHSSVECQMFSPRQCENCAKTAPSMSECAGCNDAWYCNRNCQRTDWKSHKSICKEVQASIRSLAETLQLRRSPTDKTSRDFPYYIGNIIAIDLLQLDNNEMKAEVMGDELSRDYHILSVGCGNLRNMVLTAGSLPDDYQGKLHITLNDYDPFVMARNVLLLFMLVRFADDDDVASSLTTIWYSLHLPKREYDMIKTSLDELIQSNAKQIFDATKGLVKVLEEDLSPMRKIWEQWQSMECQRDKSNSINLGEQRKVLFQNANMAHNLSNYFEELSGTEKKMVKHWFDHALFFPTERKQKNIPFDNPTLTGRQPAFTATSQSPEESPFVYSVNTDAFPFSEWDCLRVREKTVGSLSSPMVMYHNYVTDLLQKVKTLILQGRIHVHVSLANCLDFPKHHQSLNMPNYDRIFTSNLADYLGIPTLLQTFKPLLNTNNSFSVIIVTYMNWLGLIPRADTKIMFMLQFMSDKFQECSAAFCEDTKKDFPLGPNNLREYHNNTSYFLQYLRADIMAGGRGIPPLEDVPSFGSVKGYNGMQMRNFRKGMNKLIPFMYRKNARDLTMMNGSDRAVEWCLPESQA
ncbi:uncharacterized protein LOC110978891 isoform X2 [Acanthaster planci]|nr:uncharacterized protein LOC110978891 isoform X2 [Acanthaster planci]